MNTKENNICAKMLSMENFSDWLLKEIEKKNWSQSDLVKAAGISRGTLSNILSGNRGIGEKSLTAIAHALNLSTVTVFRKAGLLPAEGYPNALTVEDWEYLFSQLNIDEQEEIKQIAELKIERRKKETALKQLHPKKAG